MMYLKILSFTASGCLVLAPSRRIDNMHAEVASSPGMFSYRAENIHSRVMMMNDERY